MREFISGAEVIARGAIDAGCDFFAGYPITPASGILVNMMKLLPASGGVAVQGEDEIASIGFCIGASAAGKKVLTATSGPGLSLYSENIGFAQMAELPMVIVNVQRMGPATGGATTSAEGDVQFARWVTSGGYPMIVLCPTNMENTYFLIVRAFNLAERFRTPVILLTCKDLVMGRETADISLYKKESLVTRRPAKDETAPYHYEKLDDVPPFIPIGGDVITHMTTSIHGRDGVLTKDPKTMDDALRHLDQKISKHEEEIEFVDEDLEDGADTLIVAYGLAARTAMEVVERVRKDGGKISLAVVYSLWPVPKRKLAKIVGRHKKIIIPEHNMGQYALEIERLCRGLSPLFGDCPRCLKVNRIDGEMITPEEIGESCGDEL